MRLLADENLDANILRGLLRRRGAVDIIRAQDADLGGADDPVVLAWAAEHNRVLVTHDVATVTRYAFERIHAELPMPGVIEIVSGTSIGRAVDDLVLIVECLADDELADQVLYIPI
jgi:hypothetical protein